MKFKRKKITSETVVHTLATVMTFIWFIILFFPIYWLVITSFKDNADAFADPPIFTPSTLNDYNIAVDYESDVWADMTEQQFRKEMNVVLWTNMSEFTQVSMGRLNAYCRVDGEIVGSAMLKLTKYTGLRGKLWLFTGGLSPEDVISQFDAIEKAGAVKYNTLDKTVAEEKQHIDDVTKKILSYNQNYEEYVSGEISQVYWNDNWRNFTINYISAWNYPTTMGLEGGLLQAIKNSLTLAVSTMLLQLIVCGLTAYALSKLFSPKVSRAILLAFMATSMIPTTVTITASYIGLQRIGLASSMLGIILPISCSAANVLLFKGNFDGIPSGLIDAARIDGASELGIFARVVIPVSKPIFVTIGVLTFTSAWGEFFWSNIILKARAQFTVPLVLKALFSTSGAQSHYPMLMAMSLIISVPTVFTCIISQKDMSKGMVYTGLKG